MRKSNEEDPLLPSKRNSNISTTPDYEQNNVLQYRGAYRMSSSGLFSSYFHPNFLLFQTN
jgi:hypothetical protein